MGDTRTVKSEKGKRRKEFCKTRERMEFQKQTYKTERPFEEEMSKKYEVKFITEEFRQEGHVG